MLRSLRPISRRWLLRWLALAGVLGTEAIAAPTGWAQSLMVGADGSVHLDEMSGVSEPIVVEQAPELVPPSVVDTGFANGAMASPSLSGAALPSVMMPGAPMVSYAPMAVVATPRPIRHAVFGEFLFLHPTGADVFHAQQQGGVGTVPFGQIGVADLHYEPGVRVGGDWAVGDVTSLAAAYTWFESNAHSSVEAPDVMGAVGSLVHHPGVGVLVSAGPVDARSVVDFQMADADFRVLLMNDKSFWLNGSAGLRWGRLEQEFGQIGEFSGGSTGLIVTQTDIDFDGGGPKFGVDGGRTIGKRGLSVYARAGLSPLAGQFRSSYAMRNDTTAVQLVQVHWHDDRITTILDYEIGLAWTGPQRRWRFAAGYTAAYWFNAVTTPELIGAVQHGDFADASDTISFDGLTARIERMW
jgi:hypothetical protein